MTTWESLIGKPPTAALAGIAVGVSSIVGDAAAVRKFVRSLSNAVAWDTLQLADLPVNAAATRKFLRSVSSGAATWDTLTAADIAAGTFGAGNYDGMTNLSVATAYKVGGTQVLTSRQTGWVAPTGTLSRATFDQSTVTLAQLAQRVAALVTDLMAHGAIGT